jgi:hypothetical protein
MTDASADRLPLRRESRVAVSRDAVSAALDGETVILGMRDGVYYGLDTVGSRIWTLAAQPTTLGAIHDAIVAEYRVAPEVAWNDLLALAHDLIAAGLLTRPADP